jgi:hypothetical protein
MLEDRCTPSLWVGTENGNWSNPANWIGGVPTTGGTAVFNPGAGGANTDSVDDIANLSLSTLTIDGSYTCILNVTQNLTLTSISNTQAGGAINISARLTVAPGAAYTWTNGTLEGPGIFEINFDTVLQLKHQIANPGVLDIAPSATGNLVMATNLENRGTFNWSGGAGGSFIDMPGGTINNYPNSASIPSDGIINIGTAGTLSGGGGWLVNNGMISVIGVTGTLNLDVETGNYGVITDSEGSLQFGSALPFLNEGALTQTGPALSFGGDFYQEVSASDPSPSVLLGNTTVSLPNGNLTVAAGTVTSTPGTSAVITAEGALYVEQTAFVAVGLITINQSINIFQGATLGLAGSQSTLVISASAVNILPEQNFPPVFNPGWPGPSPLFPNVVIGPRVPMLLIPSARPMTQQTHAILEATSTSAQNIVNALVSNSDTITIASGSNLTINGNVTQYEGVTDAAGGLTVPGAYTVNVTGGTVEGNFTVGATMTIGGADADGLDVTGNVTVTGLVTTEGLAVTGTLTNNGELHLLNGYPSISATTYIQQTGVLDLWIGAYDAQNGALNATNATFSSTAIVNVTAPYGPPQDAYVQYEIVNCSNIAGGVLPMIEDPSGLYTIYLTQTSLNNTPPGIVLCNFPELVY